MSLDFTGNGRNVNIGSAAGIDDMDPVTFMAWVFCTDITRTINYICNKAVGAATLGIECIVTSAGGNGRVQARRGRATSPAVARTSTTIAQDAWAFIAATYNLAGSPICRVFLGNETTLATEAAYAIQNDGAGATNSDASANMWIGNSSSATTAYFSGLIYDYTFIKAIASLNQIRNWQRRPRNLASVEVEMFLGLHGTGTQPDLSGNGHNGTVTGATQNTTRPRQFRPRVAAA